MTDGLLPGVDRDLVRPLHKQLQQDFEAIYLSAKVVRAGRQGRLRSKSAFEGDVPSRCGGSAACCLRVGRRPNSDGLGLENTEGRRSIRRAFSSSTASGARPTRTSSPSATWPASRCWPTRPRTRGRRPSRRSPARPPLRAPGHPRRRLHRSGDRLGRTDRDGGQAAEPRRLGGPVPLGRQRPRPGDRARTDGLTKWIIDPASERLLGCGIVGSGAGELIAEAVLAIEMGCHGPRPRRDHPSASDAERDPRRGGGGLLRHGDGPLSPETAMRENARRGLSG